MSAHEKRRERYHEWLTSQQMRFRFDRDLATLSDRTRGTIRNTIPPVELWGDIIPTVRLLEAVRERFGATTLLSAYRSPDYNKAVGGAKASQHMDNTAIDFMCEKGRPEEWAAFLRDARNAKLFLGGIGTYKTFVHLDTRGYNADWSGVNDQ